MPSGVAGAARSAGQDDRQGRGDARLAAYSTVCADKKDSLFEIICSPRKLSGPQGDKAARFGNGASVRVRFSFQLHTRGWPRNPKQGLLAKFGVLA